MSQPDTSIANIINPQLPVSKLKHSPSMINRIKQTYNNQDFKQRLHVAQILALELYRLLMGSFLVVFIPQKCGQDICSITQNVQRNDALSLAAISLNAFTMFAFIILYAVEVKREHKLITYLDVNLYTPTDNDSVGNALLKLEPEKTQIIWKYDKYYTNVAYGCTVSFIINAIMSSIVVYNNYLDSKTITVYLTNLLFMGMKVAEVYSIVHTKKNIFYSAYLKSKVQFNDVDPDKAITHYAHSDNKTAVKLTHV